MDGGLAMEWTQSTPLTGDLWQEIWLQVLPVSLDTFRAWEGEPYPTEPAVITVQTPIIDGQPGTALLNVTCGEEGVTTPFLQVFDIVGARRVLLQAYPSGACELFVNGRLAQRTVPRTPRSWPDSVRIALGGRTYRTDILIGEFRVWEGVAAPTGSIPGRRPNG